ncbi:MAG: sugar ABC transporter substrate-binding protein [Lachnospiraceae bacterium]|nr:sugar ABC transporter substrate-binding protein [Lachnospiraceae bacterium]
MKKKLLSLILCSILGLTLLAGCGNGATDTPTTDVQDTENANETETGDTNDGSTFRVGITLQNLQNPFWGGLAAYMETLMTEKGWEYTILDCDDNSAVQISQVENFIASGKDLILAHPSDPQGIEEVFRQAQEAGIITMSWDDILENSNLNWILDNTELGYAIGSAAADFINEHYTADEPAQVIMINYPATPVLLERETGILDALEANAAGLYEVIASQPALDAATAMSHVETILQANPNASVVVSIGAGGDVGANEAFMVATGGDIPDDMGIFSADATLQQLEAIQAGQATRVSVGFEGSSRRTAIAVVDLFEQLLSGGDLPQNIVRILTPIDINNVDDFIADYRN